MIRRVFDEYGDGACLEVGPWPDAPDTALEIRTVSDDSVKYYGKVNITISRKCAKALGEALIAASQDRSNGDVGEE